MQWFVSWGIFTWIGKVSYGFYLMQFLTIYGLMPHLVLHFAAQGHSYWNVVVPTYILCLMFNFFIAWSVPFSFEGWSGNQEAHTRKQGLVPPSRSRRTQARQVDLGRPLRFKA